MSSRLAWATQKALVKEGRGEKEGKEEGLERGMKEE